MNNSLSLYEKKRFKTLVLESNGVLTEGRLSDISNYVKKILSPKKTEEIKQELTQNLGVDENSSKEDIENAILEKTGGETKLSLVKRALQEVLGFGVFWLVWDITNYILGSAIGLSDYNPVAILSVVIFVIFSNTEEYEKGRRKILGPKIDKFIYGKKSHLGDYDDENKDTKNESRKQKKVIKLTEQDLVRLIKRIMKENK